MSGVIDTDWILETKPDPSDPNRHIAIESRPANVPVWMHDGRSSKGARRAFPSRLQVEKELNTGRPVLSKKQFDEFESYCGVLHLDRNQDHSKWRFLKERYGVGLKGDPVHSAVRNRFVKLKTQIRQSGLPTRQARRLIDLANLIFHQKEEHLTGSTQRGMERKAMRLSYEMVDEILNECLRGNFTRLQAEYKMRLDHRRPRA